MNEPVRNKPNKNNNEIKRIAPQRKRNQIPEEIINNKALNKAIEILPSNYNFEIHKTIWRIKTDECKVVALQFPEGLLMYACVIADILERFAQTKVIIMADVTYGACCIDDFTANKIGADLLIHYGHSCLVPVNITTIKVLYVFVEIQFDISHIVACIKNNFLCPSSSSPLSSSESSIETRPLRKIAIMGTIQFASAIHTAITQLKSICPEESQEIFCPQAKPLSSGETLGCTSPVLRDDCEAVIFIADGRFHLESVMIQNPFLASSFYRYDPYSKLLTHEGYDTNKMRSIRWDAITQARSALSFGIILGTLGRQGNQLIFNRMRRLLREWDEREKHFSGKNRNVVLFLMAELNPQKLSIINGIDCWVQISCPRLSIDWGREFSKPTLTSYEFEVLIGTAQWGEVYPMDYYRKDAGTWNNYYIEK